MLNKYYTVANTANGDVISYTVDILTDLSTSTYSLSDVEYLLHQHRIYPRFKICLLNPDGTTKYEIPQSDIIPGGSYNENYQNGVRRTCSFALNNITGAYTPNINNLWSNTLISLDMGLESPDNTQIIWFKKGVYIIQSISPSSSSSEKTVQVSCQDKFGILQGKMGTLATTYTIEEGANIREVVEDILTYGSGNGFPLDSSPIIYPSIFQDKTLPIDVEESAGSTFGDIVLKMADILSAEVFYNVNGNLTFVPIVEVTHDGDKPLTYEFNTKDGDCISESFNFDMDSYINHIIVTGANVNGHTCRAEAVNNDASSPLCSQRIGLRTGSIINDTNITNDILAQERADYELRLQLIAKSQFSSEVLINPLLEVNTLVSYVDDFFDLKYERFLIESLSCSIGYDGVMSLTMSNINNLPFVS